MSDNDITRVHERLDELVEKMGEQDVRLSVIETKISALSDWRIAILGTLTAIGGGVVALFTSHFGGKQ